MTGRTPDTSVVVAGLSAWHSDHESARGALAARPPVIAHVIAESYAVLTRLPRPRRLRPRLVADALIAAFPDDPIALPSGDLRSLIETLAEHNIVGGGTYDALVAETARHHNLTLVSIDHRARATYEAIGVDVSGLA